MVKKIFFLKKNKLFLIGLVVTLSLSWPLFVAPYFSHHDDVQVIRIYEMSQCLKDGQIPCRWVPDLGGGYGYPLYNYYGPLPYYIGALIYLLTGSLLLATKFIFFLPLVGGYIFMYLLGRKLWGEYGAVLSAVSYGYAPYHALVMYVRGAIGEFWGLMFIPAIVWAYLILKDQMNVKRILILGLFIGLLITSHNLSALVFLPLLIVYFIVDCCWNFNFKFVKYTIAAFILGFALSCFYWLPMIVERNLVHVDTTVIGYFSYTEHFKGIRKLFLERDWQYGTSVREVPGGERDSLSYQVGIVHVLFWVLVLILFWRYKEKTNRSLIIFSSVVILFLVFMINPRSEFLWKILDQLKYLQFPWRLLGLISFFISLVIGGIFKFLPKKIILWVWVLGIAFVIDFNFNYFRPAKFLYMNEEQFLEGDYWDYQRTRSIFDYLPKSADAPPAQVANVPYQLLTGDSAQIYNFQKGTNWFIFDAKINGHTIVRLSQYYFPNFRLWINNKEEKIDYKNSLGLMTILLGKGDYQVFLKLYNTPVRMVANLVSLFGILSLLSITLWQSKRFKRWISYFVKELNR